VALVAQTYLWITDCTLKRLPRSMRLLACWWLTRNLSLVSFLGVPKQTWSRCTVTYYFHKWYISTTWARVNVCRWLFISYNNLLIYFTTNQLLWRTATRLLKLKFWRAPPIASKLYCHIPTRKWLEGHIWCVLLRVDHRPPQFYLQLNPYSVFLFCGYSDGPVTNLYLTISWSSTVEHSRNFTASFPHLRLKYHLRFLSPLLCLILYPTSIQTTFRFG